MADRVIVLREGNVEQVGSPLELYDKPENIFVASFIGSPAMNLIHGSFENANGTLQFTPQNAGPITIPANTLPCADDLVPGQDYQLGIRPEHISLQGTGTAASNDGSHPGIAAEVVLVEVTGLDTQIVAVTQHGEVTVLVRGRVDAKAGDSLSLFPDFRLANVFHASTGTRVG